MSQSPQDPFSANPNAAPGTSYANGPQEPGGLAGGGPGYPNGGPPQKSKSVLPWILGILGILAVVGLVCCGGIAYIGFQARDQITAFTGEIFKQQYEDGLNADPDFAEHMGQVESMAMDFTATGQYAQENPDDDGPPWVVFDVTGTRGNGTIRIRVDQDSEEPMADAVLTLDDGTEYPMTIPVNESFDDFNTDELNADESDIGADFDIDLGA